MSISDARQNVRSETYLQAKKKQKRSSSQRRSLQGSPKGKDGENFESEKTEPAQALNCKIFLEHGLGFLGRMEFWRRICRIL
jgi:hypothetical protein